MSVEKQDKLNTEKIKIKRGYIENIFLIIGWIIGLILGGLMVIYNNNNNNNKRKLMEK